MNEFFEQLRQLLTANNGDVGSEQVVELLPYHARHRLAFYLNAARQAGVCKVVNVKADGTRTVRIRSAGGSG